MRAATASLAERVRQDFPILRQTVHGKPLIYLDNAATSQKPQSVIDAMTGFYTHDCANVHRGVYLLSERATDSYEAARAYYHSAEYQAAKALREGAADMEMVLVEGAYKPECKLDDKAITGLNQAVDTWIRKHV